MVQLKYVVPEDSRQLQQQQQQQKRWVNEKKKYKVKNMKQFFLFVRSFVVDFHLKIVRINLYKNDNRICFRRMFW